MTRMVGAIPRESQARARLTGGSPAPDDSPRLEASDVPGAVRSGDLVARRVATDPFEVGDPAPPLRDPADRREAVARTGRLQELHRQLRRAAELPLREGARQRMTHRGVQQRDDHAAVDDALDVAVPLVDREVATDL